jgi:hypothetical protein
MRIYREHEIFADGDTFTPLEINEEIRSVVHEFNTGLDRDNLGLTLPTGKLAVDAITERYFWDTGVAQNVTILSEAAVGQLHAVPDETGAPVTALVTTVDGLLVIEANLTVRSTLVPDAYLAILVDGEVAAKTPATGFGQFAIEPLYTKVYLPVAAGRHRVELKFGRLTVYPTDEILTFRGRCLRIRHGKR